MFHCTPKKIHSLAHFLHSRDVNVFNEKFSPYLWKQLQLCYNEQIKSFTIYLEALC